MVRACSQGTLLRSLTSGMLSPSTTRLRSFATGLDTLIPGWDLYAVQTTAGRIGGDSRDLQLDGIQVLHEAFRNVSTNQFGRAPADAYVFGVPRVMPQSGRFNGREWCNGITAWDGRRAFDSIVPPMELFSLSVERRLLAEQVRITERVDLEHWLAKGCIVVNDAALGQQLSQQIAVLFDGFFEHGDGMPSPRRQQLVRDALLEVLAPVVAERLAAQAAPRYDVAHLYVVRRAREVALDRIDEPLQVRDLCEATGACRRSLQNSFQAVLDTTPLQYLRALRLDGARRSLLAGTPGLTVTQVAEEWGFWHLSRFGQDYRRTFGELPSETLRRIGFQFSAGSRRTVPDAHGRRARAVEREDGSVRERMRDAVLRL